MSGTPVTYIYRCSTIPEVIDALLTVFSQLPSCQPPVAVYDGRPVGDLPDTFVVVGNPTGDVVAGGQDWASLGGNASRRTETYEVTCSISAYVGGQNAWTAQASGGDSQQSSRSAAFKIFNDLASTLWNDPNLTLGTTTPILASGWCQVSKIDVHQTFPGDEESGKGSTTDINFTVAVRNQLAILGT